MNFFRNCYIELTNKKGRCEMKEIKTTTPIEFERGDIVHDNLHNQEWVVVCVMDHIVYMFERNTNSFNQMVLKLSEAISLVREQVWTFGTLEKKVLPDNLSKQAELELTRNRSIFKEVYDTYGPDFSQFAKRTSKKELKKIADKYSISDKQVKRILLKYIQNGYQDYYLIDEKKVNASRNMKSSTKRGRKSKNDCGGIAITDTVAKQFDEAIKEYSKNSKETLNNVFETMLGKYYMIETDNGIQLADYDERPHIDQFIYYYRNKTDHEKIERKRTGTREWMNSKRPLRGTSRSGVLYPGFLIECDEEEYPVYLVDEHERTKVIGKPVVYWGIDNYSNMIVMVHVSFENNSYLGATNMLMCLKQNKNELLNAYGLPPIQSEVWPSNFTPVLIVSDRGSEYIGGELKRACTELGILHEVTTPAKGSAKGTVERLNEESVNELSPYLKYHGLVTLDHEDDAVKNAIFDIDQFTTMILQFVIKHNQQTITNPNFKYPPELMKELEKGNPITRVQLWQFGIKKYGMPRPLPPIDQFLWTLMVPDKASISRKGLYYHELMYFAPDDEDFKYLQIEAGTHSLSIDIRYDPRTVGNVYFVINGKLHKASIDVSNPILNEVAKLSRKTFDDLYLKTDILNDINMKINIPLDAKAKDVYQAVTEAAMVMHPNEKNVKKEIHANNRIAKEIQRQNESMQNTFMKEPSVNLQNTNDHIDTLETKTTLIKIDDTESSQSNKSSNDDMDDDEIQASIMFDD